jgi:hypothetical protein
MAELVREPSDEGRLGTDDDEIDSKLARKRYERRRIVGPCGVARRQGGDSRVAGRGVQLAEAAAAGERPRERMLAAARTYEENLHAS